jgi:hypothetical protein
VRKSDGCGWWLDYNIADPHSLLTYETPGA